MDDDIGHLAWLDIPLRFSFDQNEWTGRWHVWLTIATPTARGAAFGLDMDSIEPITHVLPGNYDTQADAFTAARQLGDSIATALGALVTRDQDGDL